MEDESYEDKLEQRLTQVVDKRSRPIKQQLGKLTGRVQSLELMNFQEQLDRLNERITEFSKELLTLQQLTCGIKIDTLVDRHREVIEGQLPK